MDKNALIFVTVGPIAVIDVGVYHDNLNPNFHERFFKIMCKAPHPRSTNYKLP